MHRRRIPVRQRRPLTIVPRCRACHKGFYWFQRIRRVHCAMMERRRFKFDIWQSGSGDLLPGCRIWLDALLTLFPKRIFQIYARAY